MFGLELKIKTLYIINLWPSLLALYQQMIPLVMSLSLDIFFNLETFHLLL